MDDASLIDTQPPLLGLQPQLGIPLGRRLRVLESDGQRAVFVGATAIHLYDAYDRGAEAAAIALLARARIATQIQLGEAFGCHRNTVARLEQRLEQAGMAGVVPAKRGPKGPHKVTPAVWEVVSGLSHLSRAEVTRAIEERTGVWLHVTSVGRLLKQVRAAAAEQAVLWQEPEPAPEAGPELEPEGAEPPAAEVPVAGQEPVQGTGEPPVVLPEQALNVSHIWR